MRCSKSVLAGVFPTFVLLSIVAFAHVSSAMAGEIFAVTGGSANITIDIDKLSANEFYPNGVLTFDRYFGSLENQAATMTRTQMVATNPPPVAPPGSPTSGSDLNFAVNGNPVTSPQGRARQATNLQFDRSDVLGSWTPPTGTYPFLPGGEQIGLDGVLRMTVADEAGGGLLLLGDFALKYAPSLASAERGPGLVLLNNFDYRNAVSFYLFDVQIQTSDTMLTITADLLMSEALAGLTGGANLANVGTFALNATITPVPEPGSVVLGVIAAGILAFRSMRARGLRKATGH